VESGTDFREGQGAVEGLYPGAVMLYRLKTAFEQTGIMIAYVDFYEQQFAKQALSMIHRKPTLRKNKPWPSGPHSGDFWDVMTSVPQSSPIFRRSALLSSSVIDEQVGELRPD
jgi:hypothetical protein